jgi:hypothetical protein
LGAVGAEAALRQPTQEELQKEYAVEKEEDLDPVAELEEKVAQLDIDLYKARYQHKIDLYRAEQKIANLKKNKSSAEGECDYYKSRKSTYSCFIFNSLCLS